MDMKTIRKMGLLVSLMALAPSVLWAQAWDAKPQGGKTYVISVGKNTQDVLTPFKYYWESETRIAFQKYIDGKDKQKWKLVEVPNKQDCYQLVNAEGELAFDMALNDPKQNYGLPLYVD